MIRLHLSTVILAAGLAVTGCADALLPENPVASPNAVAEALWTEVDEYFAWFELKGVDWDAVGAEHLPRVSSGTSDRELFAILSTMLETLHDGHVSLETPFDRFQWTAWYDAYPANFRDGVAPGYLTAKTGSDPVTDIRWGLISEGIGYLRIPRFDRGETGRAVDDALRQLGPLTGLVIDVRSNGGGTDLRSQAAAGRFMSATRHYRTARYKSGPDHDDFGPELRYSVGPQGRESFDGPIVVLQNRRTYSAAEDFLLAMRVREDVTFIGDFTGGGAGNPIWRELPNGWLLSVSRWQAYAADGTSYEGTGLAPDVRVESPDAALRAGRDRILERAVEILGGR